MLGEASENGMLLSKTYVFLLSNTLNVQMHFSRI